MCRSLCGGDQRATCLSLWRGLWEKSEQTRGFGKGKNSARVRRGGGAETRAGPGRMGAVSLVMVERVR